MTKLEGKQGKGSSEPIREDNREYPRSYTGKHSREGRFGYEQDKHVQKMSSKFNKDFKKRRHQDKKREEQHDTPHDCIRVEMCDFYGRENARDHNTDMYEIVYNEPSRPVYRRGQVFRMSIRFKDRQFEPDHDNVRLVFNFGPNPSVPKETKVYLPLTSSENRYDEEKINNWDANISRIDGNCMDVEVFIPADAPVGVWHCWVETCPEGFSYYRRDGSPYYPRSRSPCRKNRSPYRRNRSDFDQREDSYRRSGSPYRWDWAPYYRDESAYPRDRDYFNYDDQRRRNEGYSRRERRGRSRSPFRRSRSEGYGDSGLYQRDNSQSRRRNSPYNRRNSRDDSPYRRSHSRERRDQSSSRRYRSRDRNDSREFRDSSPYRGDRSYDNRRDRSLNRRGDSRDRRDSKRVRLGGSLDRGLDRRFRRSNGNNRRDINSYEREGRRGWKYSNPFRRDRRSRSASRSDSNRGYRDQSPRGGDYEFRNEDKQYSFEDQRNDMRYRRDGYRNERDNSPFRMDCFKNRSSSRTNFFRDRRDDSPFGMDRDRYGGDGSPFRRDFSRSQRDVSPNRMNRYRDQEDGSPFRMDRYRGQRDNSPYRMNRDRNDRDSSPFRMNRFVDQKDNSPYRRRRDGNQEEYSPFRRNRYGSQRDSSPFREDGYRSPRDSSPYRMDGYRSQRDSSPYRRNDYRDQRDSSPYEMARFGAKRDGNYFMTRREGSSDRENNFMASRNTSPFRRRGFEGRRNDSPYRDGSFRQDGRSFRFDGSRDRREGYQSRRFYDHFGYDDNNSYSGDSPYRRDNSYRRYGYDGNRNDLRNFRCRSSSPYQRGREYSQQEMRRSRSYSPYEQDRDYMNRFMYSPKRNEQYGSRYGGYGRSPFRQSRSMSEFGYRRRSPYNMDSRYRQDFNQHYSRDPSSRQNDQYRRGYSPYNRSYSPYSQDGDYNNRNYENDSYSRREFGRNFSSYGGNNPNRRNSPYRGNGRYQQGRSRDASPFRCGRTPFRRGGSPYRRHQSAPYSLDGSPYRNRSSPFRRNEDFNERRRGRSADRSGVYRDAYNFNSRDGDWGNRRDDMRGYGRDGDRRYDDYDNRSFGNYGNRRYDDIDNRNFRNYEDRRYDDFDNRNFRNYGNRRYDDFDNRNFRNYGNRRYDDYYDFNDGNQRDGYRSDRDDDQSFRRYDDERNLGQFDRYDRRNRNFEGRYDRAEDDKDFNYRRYDRYGRGGYDKRDDRFGRRKSYDAESDRDGYFSDYRDDDYYRFKQDSCYFDRNGNYPYDFNGEVFKCKQDIFILFNPWCKDDPTYMEDEVCRREYVLNDMGKVWIGTYRRNRGRRWVFGQFDDVVLPAVMYMMEEARLSGTDRANPIQMVRAITEMVNNRDHDGSHSSKRRKNGQGNCVMIGRWDGKYDDGVSPYSWTGSARILEQYMRTGKPVKYGQCWVFAAVTTTICRALGIPCRPVTNFVSAHDTNNSMSVDKYFSCNGDEIERGPDGDSWDSVWSFHSWNDVWMDRPDLPPGCGGWQAIDSTYQEECDGRYKCGPASLDCIRRGDIGFNYDTRYIFTEVNAEINHWQQDENSDWGFTRMRPGHYHVGCKMLTKAPDFDDDEYDEDCMNVIDEYKPRDAHQEHDRILNAFRGIEHSHRIKKHNRLYMDHEDVIFELEELPRVYIGQPFLVEMHIMNRSGETRSIEAMLSCHSMYYNGVKNKRVMQDKAFFVVPPNEHETFILRINPEDYEDKMVDMCMMKIYAISNVKETGQVWGEEDDFCFEKPRLQIQTRGSHQVGQDMEASFTFINPLRVTLTNCRFTFEGPGLQRSRTVKCRDVKPGETVNHVERFVPKQPGETKIVAAFTSHQLNDVYGSRKVAFKG